MSLDSFITRTWQENILFNVLIELTYSCNLDCFFCYNDRNLQGQPLSLEQYYRLLQDLADMGVLNLVLSGGEPLAHPRFWEIAARARELGFVIRIKSNGHALRRELAQRLKQDVDPFVIEISLHGATEEVHDRQTRVAGSFRRLMKNLPVLKDLGLRVRLNSTLTAWNEHQIEAMHALADDLGFPLHMDPQVTPRDDGDTSPLEISASPAGVQRLVALQRSRHPLPDAAACDGMDASSALSGEKHCGTGSSSLAIDPVGNVYPCVAYRQAVGNLHQASVTEIWQHSSQLEKIRQVAVDTAQTLRKLGPESRSMGFCPGQAQLTTGNPVEIYASALRVLNAHQKAAALTED